MRIMAAMLTFLAPGPQSIDHLLSPGHDPLAITDKRVGDIDRQQANAADWHDLLAAEAVVEVVFCLGGVYFLAEGL
jgi:hypothetical protein